jgi:hypothetical protein
MTSSLYDVAAVPTRQPAPEPARQVRVWFGQQVVVRYEGSPVEAAHYEATMRRRFAAARVTNEAVPSR